MHTVAKGVSECACGESGWGYQAVWGEACPVHFCLALPLQHNFNIANVGALHRKCAELRHTKHPHPSIKHDSMLISPRRGVVQISSRSWRRGPPAPGCSVWHGRRACQHANVHNLRRPVHCIHQPPQGLASSRPVLGELKQAWLQFMCSDGYGHCSQRSAVLSLIVQFPYQRFCHWIAGCVS